MTRPEFSVPRLGAVRRSTLVLAALFVAVLTLYLLVRPVPEIARTGRTAEPTENAQVTRPDPARDEFDPTPKRAPTPTPTPRARTTAPVPTAAPSTVPRSADPPGPGADQKASADPLLPLLAPRASPPPDPSAPPTPAG